MLANFSCPLIASDVAVTFRGSSTMVNAGVIPFARRLTVQRIKEEVRRYYGLRQIDMMSARRDRAVARPRQIAMFLACELTTMSLPEIGKRFSKDHTTVLYARRQIQKLVAEDGELEADVAALRERLAV